MARIWYNSMFEQKYTQYKMLFYAFLILQAYKPLKGMNFGHFYRLKCFPCGTRYNGHTKKYRWVFSFTGPQAQYGLHVASLDG